MEEGGEREGGREEGRREERGRRGEGGGGGGRREGGGRGREEERECFKQDQETSLLPLNYKKNVLHILHCSIELSITTANPGFTNFNPSATTAVRGNKQAGRSELGHAMDSSLHRPLDDGWDAVRLSDGQEERPTLYCRGHHILQLALEQLLTVVHHALRLLCVCVCVCVCVCARVLMCFSKYMYL